LDQKGRPDEADTDGHHHHSDQDCEIPAGRVGVVVAVCEGWHRQRHRREAQHHSDDGGGEATGPLPPGGGNHAGAGHDQVQQRQRHQRRCLPCVVLQCGDDVRRPSNAPAGHARDAIRSAARPAMAWSPAGELVTGDNRP